MRQSVERATRCRPDDGATQLGADNGSERLHGGQLTQLSKSRRSWRDTDLSTQIIVVRSKPR